MRFKVTIDEDELRKMWPGTICDYATQLEMLLEDNLPSATVVQLDPVSE